MEKQYTRDALENSNQAQEVIMGVEEVVEVAARAT